MHIFFILERENYIHYIISCFKNSTVNQVNSSELVEMYLIHPLIFIWLSIMCMNYILLSIFLFRGMHIFLEFLFLPSFCPSLLFFLFPYHPFFFFLFLWWFLPNLHQSRQCSDKYLYTFLNFCKISPSPKVVTKYITRCFYMAVHTSLQQSTLLSAMNESIYVFTSLPEPKLSFFFIFVTSMGKKWCFL